MPKSSGDGWQDADNLPWPEGTPHPPSHLAHPFNYASKHAMLRQVPTICWANWATLLTQAANDLSDAVEARDDDETARALHVFLTLPHALRRPSRGKSTKGKNQAYHRIERFLNAVQNQDTYTDQDDKRENTRSTRSEEQIRINRAEILVKEGYRSRAARLIRTDDTINLPTPEIHAKLEQKFPLPRYGHDQRDFPKADASNPRYTVELKDFIAN
jgi:hypothetical protein